MTEARVAILEQGLRKLLRPMGFFSICDLEALIELAGTIPPPGVLQEFRALHCVSYRDMSDDVRAVLPGLIESCFADRWLTVQIFPTESDESKPAVPPIRLRRRLLRC